MPPPPICPKCENQMKKGWIKDSVESAQTEARWIAGEVERRPIFFGMVEEIILEGKTIKPLTAYRCPECGYVELYAA
jgi:predicted nucleic-acid-binding Zn-ribbon protein